MQVKEVTIKTNNIDKVKTATSEALEQVLAVIGMTAEKYAKLLCPVDTGLLRNSITNEVVAADKVVYIGTNVEYAPYVEMGTSRAKAQPYIRPAIENHIDEYQRIVEERLASISI